MSKQRALIVCEKLASAKVVHLSKIYICIKFLNVTLNGAVMLPHEKFGTPESMDLKEQCVCGIFSKITLIPTVLKLSVFMHALVKMGFPSRNLYEIVFKCMFKKNSIKDKVVISQSKSYNFFYKLVHICMHFNYFLNCRIDVPLHTM